VKQFSLRQRERPWRWCSEIAVAFRFFGAHILARHLLCGSSGATRRAQLAGHIMNGIDQNWWDHSRIDKVDVNCTN
jgi:hypothetical protein